MSSSPDPTGFYQEGEYYSFYDEEAMEMAQDLMLTDYICHTPFPTYDETVEQFKKRSKVIDGLIIHLSEYSMFAHASLAVIYQDWTNPDTGNRLRKLGQKIHDMGGINAMQGVFYVFCQAGPFSTSKESYIALQYKLLEIAWHGVGEWCN